MRRGFHLQEERGSTLVEYALVLLVFLTLILGIMEFGRVALIYSTLANAAREGARYGIIHPGDDAGAETAASAHITGLDPARLILTASSSSDTVTVSADYTADLLTGLFGADIPLHAESTMRLE